MAEPQTVPILAPMAGRIIDMGSVPDPVFAGKKLGDGFGIVPESGTVVSPVTGTVTMVAKTLHAVGFATESGLEYLLHLGVDTVELGGAPFAMDLEKGQQVTAGQQIGTMDVAAVVAAGKETTAILAITNSKKKVAALALAQGTLAAGERAADAEIKVRPAAAPAAAAGSSASAAGAGAASGAVAADGHVMDSPNPATAHHAPEPDPVDALLGPEPERVRPAGLTGFDALAFDIIEGIGGPENVASVIHCITRVRFYLKDQSKADDAFVSDLDGVIDVARAAGQYQVVIGPAVTDVYDAVVKQLGTHVAGGETDPAAEAVERPTTAWGWVKHSFSSLIGVITGSMIPIIGLLAASGVLKGILTMLTHFHLVDPKGQTFTMIDAMGDAVFYFMPIFVGFTAAKRLGSDPIIVSIIGGVLAYPTIHAMAAADANGSILGVATNAEFFGIPFPMASYTYSIFPMIVAAWLAAKLEPMLKKITPPVLRMIFVPLLEVFLVSLAILVVLGPIITFLSTGLAGVIQWVYELSPAISGLVIGAFYQCLVIFGLHWAVIPLIAADISERGHSYLNAIISTTMVAQGAGVLAVFLKTRNQKIKGLAGSAAIAAFAGITEPAMYGINLKYGKIFALASIGSAVGGFLTGFLNVNMWGFTGSLIGFFSFVNPEEGFDGSWSGFWISHLVTLVISFLAVYFFGFKDHHFDSGREVKKVSIGRRDPMRSRED